MTTRYRICQDVFLHPYEDRVWVLSNPRVHSHIQVDGQAMTAIMELSGGAPDQDWIAALSKGRGWDRTRFTNADGLMADPTGIGPVSGEALSGGGLFSALKKSWMVHRSDGNDYRDFLALKNSPMDTDHLGSFHQILGRYQLLVLRTKETWKWWHDQKFTPDGREVRAGLYKWVQDYFFKSYFGKMNLAGARVLDYACGNGYYSEQFRLRGADVLGVDLSDQLIALARSNYGKDIRFEGFASEEAGLEFLASLPAAHFDLIYLSDALLFFFYDIKTHAPRKEYLRKVLTLFKRLLRPSGKIFIMEPNGAFWLTSRFGAPGRPVAVVTEYRQRLFHVAPTMDQVVNALADANLMIAHILHPDMDPSAGEKDPAAFAFCGTFPLWDFYCIVAP